MVGIFLSHELSGTCQCARLAADMANVDNVLFVDSENVCLGESLLVRLAVQLRDAGKTAGQIAATLEPVSYTHLKPMRLTTLDEASERLFKASAMMAMEPNRVPASSLPRQSSRLQALSLIHI